MVMSIDWVEVWGIAKPFLIFLGGLVLYGVFIFSFYEKASRRLIFVPERREYKGAAHPDFLKFWSGLVYGFKYVFIAPIIIFVWFVILACLLMLMNSNMLLKDGLLLGMTTLAAIRITSYYRQSLAEDLAKILPLAMLALFLVDRSEINLPLFWSKVQMLPESATILLVYFGVTIVLEFLARVFDAVANRE